MKKFVVTIALLILILGVISFLISETRVEEDIIDEWNPITPSTLYTHWDLDLNEFNSTGSFFIDRAKSNNKKFKQLFEQGEISELFLELNVTASGFVRVRVGKWASGIMDFLNTTFDEKGMNITGRVEVDVINSSANADYLEIANEDVNPVNISGYMKLKGKMPEVFYPFYGFGTLMCLLGVSLVFYGLLAKPKRKRVLTRALYGSLAEYDIRDVTAKRSLVIVRLYFIYRVLCLVCRGR